MVAPNPIANPMPPAPDLPLYWLDRSARRLAMITERHLKSEGIDASYWPILHALSEGRRLSIAEIAETCVLKPTTATKTVQRMAAQGFVTTGRRDRDARVTEVRLTETGQGLGHRAQHIVETLCYAALADVSDAERDQMDRLHRHLFETLA